MTPEIIARIKATVPAIKLVGEAADFQTAVENNPKITPACFVIPLQEMPERAEFAGAMLQQVAVAVGVIIVIRNVADTTGAAAKANIDTLRKQIKDQLYGWKAETQLDPFERGASNLLAFREGHMWWQDVYLTSYFDRSL